MVVTFDRTTDFVQELRDNVGDVWLRTVRVEELEEPLQQERITFRVGLHLTAVIQNAEGDAYLIACVDASDEPIVADEVYDYLASQQRSIAETLAELGLKKAGGRYTL